MSALRACVRPVIFETGVEGTPYTVMGTAFLVAFDARVFVLTARHVVREWPIEKLVVFPADRSHTPFHMTECFRISTDLPGEDVEDFLVIEVNVASLDAEERRTSRLIHLTPSADDWLHSRFSASFFLIGYPEAKNYVDYEEFVIHTGQVVLPGGYAAASSLPHCHVLAVENPLSLPSFSGFSGCPVFSLVPRVGIPSDLTFAGMVLRGTAGSGRVHFLEAAVLRRALERTAAARQW